MGTDISMYAERREIGVWKSCYPLVRQREAWADVPYFSYDMEEVYDNDRNYELFRILADVDRLTNHGFDTIAPPRGLPEDLSPEISTIAAFHEEEGWFCHNHSWLLLKEILAFPWHDRNKTFTGSVNAEQYLVFKERGQPEHFAAVGGSWGHGGCNRNRRPEPKTITNAEMDRLVRDGNLSSEAITEIALKFSYADYCQGFLQHTVPLLQTFGKPDDVRIVFWFDS